MIYQKYDIVSTWVGFGKNDARGKYRPVLITDIHGKYYNAIAITKHDPRSEFEGEFEIKDWKQANLRFPSTARFVVQVITEDKLIKKKIGRLTDTDIEEIKKLEESLIRTDDISVNELLEWTSLL